jgi:hypothetical protein
LKIVRNTLVVLLVLIVLLGCSPKSSQSTDHNTVMNTIPELKGCKAFTVSDGYKELWIVRCPNSHTTSINEVHSCGKNCTSHSDTSIITDSDF